MSDYLLLPKSTVVTILELKQDPWTDGKITEASVCHVFVFFRCVFFVV